jgi:hypothetical protein
MWSQQVGRGLGTSMMEEGCCTGGIGTDLLEKLASVRGRMMVSGTETLEVDLFVWKFGWTRNRRHLMGKFAWLPFILARKLYSDLVVFST